MPGSGAAPQREAVRRGARQMQTSSLSVSGCKRKCVEGFALAHQHMSPWQRDEA
jgi:hypothetical protein